jgi:hypothetical protein
VKIVQHEIEFAVVRVACNSRGAVVDGRCCRGTIAPGSVFTVLSEVDLQEIPGGFAGPSSLVPVGVVNLTVGSIWIQHGRSIGILSAGWNGRLELFGTGGELIKPRLALSIPKLDTSD